MVKFPKISVLGAGNMGGALVRGLAASKGWQPGDILVYDTQEDSLNSLVKVSGVRAAGSISQLTANASVLVSAVKPQVFPGLAADIGSNVKNSCVFISIMAGLSSHGIRGLLGPAFTVVRTMPNLPLSIGLGATAIESDNVPEEVLKGVEEIFSAVGGTVRVQGDQMDAVTALSGSGPMYIFEFIEGLLTAGVKCGLSPDVSYQLAMQTAEGALGLLQNGSHTPSEWTKKVCSPGGTTLAALGVLEAKGFKALLAEAVSAARDRSKELGK